MAGLNDLIARLQRFSSLEVVSRMGRRIADAAHEACISGFQQQRDPYGGPWAPRKDPCGTWPLLDKTGAGVDSLTARYVNGTVVMRINGYFKFHQSGTSHMPARRVFPDQARGLGMWSRPIQQAATDAVRELMK